MSIFLSFFGIPSYKFVQFTVFFIQLFIEYSFPQTFTVYQTLAISLLAMFFGEFLSLFGHNSTFCWEGGQFYADQDSLK